MTDPNLVFRLKLSDKDGKQTEYHFSAAGLGNLVTQITYMASQVPQPPSLEVEVETVENPVQATAFGISPIAGNATAARVSIVVGPIDLQFAVPLADLYEALKAMDEGTEPNPMSSHRPN